MLDYEWGSPSTIILAGNEGGVGGGEPDQTRRQIFDHNFTMLTDNNNHHNNSSNNNILHGSAAPISTTNGFFSHHHHFNFNNPPQQQHHAFFDPRAFQDASTSTTSFSPPPPPPSMLSLNSIPPLATSHFGLGPGPGLGFLLMPKSEDVIMSNNFEGSGHVLGPGLGLNLGGRTYFPSCNDDTAGGRLYRNTKAAVHTTVSSNLPRCQAEGCNADLSDAKHYHRRHKVCEYHSKAATVVTAGLTQRFCQQCSRFHLLSEFDNGKRSCRKRLADHNRRRRKTQQIAQEIHKSSLDNVVAKSSSESRAQSSPPLKVTAVLSPPDYFRQQIVANQNRGGSSSSTASAGSLFFSSG